MLDIIQKNPMIAILRNVPSDILIDYAQAVVRSGITCFEVAMNTPGGAEQIGRLKSWFGETAVIGAGTATTIHRIDSATEAGASFFLTPSVEESLLQYFSKNHLKLLPGIMTPSDVGLCLKYDYHILKLFPAGDLPPTYIKSLKGPFGETDYVAVGGVTADNFMTFFKRGFSGVGIGSNLIPKEIVYRRDWKEAENYVREHFVQVYKTAERLETLTV